MFKKEGVDVGMISNRAEAMEYTRMDAKRREVKMQKQWEKISLIGMAMFLWAISLIGTYTHASTWESLGLVGKNCWFVIVSPQDSDIMLVGAYDEGIYKTTDGGGYWELKNEGLFSLQPLTCVYDPFDSNIVYVGLDGEEGESGGIVRSFDGGETWSDTLLYGHGGVWSIAIDSHNSAIIYAGVWMSTWGGTGLYKSADTGNVWIAVTLPDGRYIRDIIIHPSSSDTLYVSTLLGGIFKSTNGGASWQSIGTSISYPYEMMFHPSNPSIIYCATSGVLPNNCQGIFKSEDGGQTWTNIGHGDKLTISALEMDITTGELLAAASISFYSGDVYVTTDDGATWLEDNLNRVTSDLYLDPNTGDIYAACFYLGGENVGGVFRRVPASINEEPAIFSNRCSLHIASNPSSDIVIVKFQIQARSSLNLSIYNINGRKIRTLFNGVKNSGAYSVIWDGRDDTGKKVSSGAYFVRFEAGDYHATRKLLIMR
ncbi:T9SS type A sorting domain-containing protein [candidate division WOR-3 bacterium]|nr:T9SS type A sorting domain-containing protein [candidate division WOR-3 bacterium]